MAQSMPLPRRVPVFFLLDDSAAVQGQFQVAMQEGVQAVQRTLLNHRTARRNVYLSVVTFGAAVQATPLQPLRSFTCEPLVARGARPLGAALRHLHHALEYAIIPDAAFGVGDIHPRVFIILGAMPDPGWEDVLAQIAAYTDNRRPQLVVLGLEAAAVREFAPTLHPMRLALRARDGHCLAQFFDWTQKALMGLSETAASGAPGGAFPPLPPQVVML
jgi:uncharacterized protein YegL